MTTLNISKIDNGTEALIGKLVFDGSNDPQLTVEGDGVDAEQLRQAWKEIASQEKIPMDENEMKEVDGEKITEFNTVLVAPNDKRYPDAIWSFLESNYGYLVDQE